MNTVNRSKRRAAGEHVLQRQHDEEGQQQAAVVAAPRVRQRDELAQREERDARRTAASRRTAPDTQASQNSTAPTHTARRSRPKALVRRCCAARAMSRSDSELSAISVTSSSSAEQDDEQQADLLGDAERAQRRPSGCTRRAARSRRARARSRKCALVLAGCSCIGAPKVTVHRIGTGTTSPLGITRCTLSIHAGISCTCGNCSARWIQPALERLRLAPCCCACPRERSPASRRCAAPRPAAPAGPGRRCAGG